MSGLSSCLPVCLAVCPCALLSAWLRICMYTNLPIYLSVYIDLSMCLPVYMSVCLSSRLSVFLYLHCTYVYLCLSASSFCQLPFIQSYSKFLWHHTLDNSFPPVLLLTWIHDLIRSSSNAAMISRLHAPRAIISRDLVLMIAIDPTNDLTVAI